MAALELAHRSHGICRLSLTRTQPRQGAAACKNSARRKHRSQGNRTERQRPVLGRCRSSPSGGERDRRRRPTELVAFPATISQVDWAEPVSICDQNPPGACVRAASQDAAADGGGCLAFWICRPEPLLPMGASRVWRLPYAASGKAPPKLRERRLRDWLTTTRSSDVAIADSQALT
jgi:hypothetical protein